MSSQDKMQVWMSWCGKNSLLLNVQTAVFSGVGSHVQLLIIKAKEIKHVQRNPPDLGMGENAWKVHFPACAQVLNYNSQLAKSVHTNNKQYPSVIQQPPEGNKFLVLIGLTPHIKP